MPSSLIAPLPLRTVTATRYVTALREGGSLPGLVEADDDGLYVVKFRAAGQGPKALIAELVGAELGRALGLAVPEVVLVSLDVALGRAEPDQEIQDLLVRSAGLNLGLDFLPGSMAFDPAAGTPPGADVPEPDRAADIVWFDAFITNVDRSARNVNLLVWHRRVWLIDHGAALYIHHTWRHPAVHARGPFERIADHVLLPYAGSISEADARLASRLSGDLLDSIAAAIPEVWLGDHPSAERRAYVDYLSARLEAPRAFVEEADRARRGA